MTTQHIDVLGFGGALADVRGIAEGEEMPIEKNPVRRVVRVRGNREPIRMRLCDNAGAAINLTGLTIVFRMVRAGWTGTVKVNDAAATLEDAAGGIVSYTPTADDINTEDTWACYFKDTTSTPNRVWPYDGARYLLRIVREGFSQ